MNVLAVIHGSTARSGVFGDVVDELGHRIEEWSLAWGTPPPRPIDDYGAVMVFGGSMHADQDDHHPWLRDENFFIQRLLDLRVPLLGVCLGAQLLAKACHASVHPASEPEIGWYPIDVLDPAADDPLLGSLPRRFEAFQWHYYTYGVPGGAVELARSAICSQAYRLGQFAWGIQFHPEVKLHQIMGWIDEAGDELLCPVEELVEETERRIDEWNDLGRRISGEFMRVAERERKVA